MSVTFEQAQAATAFTGKGMLFEMDDSAAPRLADQVISVTRATKNITTYTRKAERRLRSVSTTILRNSSMFGFVDYLFKEISTFEYAIQLEDIISNLPRDTAAGIAGYMPVEDLDSLAIFLVRNNEIEACLQKAVSRTANHPKFASGEVSVFADPEDNDYCVQINADFAAENYEEAYQIECAIFEEVIKPDFELVNYRIMLSFDTDSDD
jgi:hypothetical protein